MRSDFYKELDRYVNMVTDITNEHFKRDFPNVDKPFFTVDPKGKKYARVVQNEVHGDSRSVHSFVNMENGDILKAAGWKVPAKNARGNIFADDRGLSALTPEGRVRYLR